jgi:hypothetical protein
MSINSNERHLSVESMSNELNERAKRRDDESSNRRLFDRLHAERVSGDSQACRESDSSAFISNRTQEQHYAERRIQSTASDALADAFSNSLACIAAEGVRKNIAQQQQKQQLEQQEKLQEKKLNAVKKQQTKINKRKSRNIDTCGSFDETTVEVIFEWW